MNEYYYLVHGGPGSGRYPLGSGERPYQKFEGSRGRSSDGISGYIRARKAKKQEAERIKQENEIRAAEEAKRRHDAVKDKVLRSGKASEVLEYQGELTNQELLDVVNRFKYEATIKEMASKETKTALKKIDDVMKTVQTGTNWIKIGTDTYNALAVIYNATEDGRRHPMNVIR